VQNKPTARIFFDFRRTWTAPNDAEQKTQSSSTLGIAVVRSRMCTRFAGNNGALSTKVVAERDDEADLGSHAGGLQPANWWAAEVEQYRRGVPRSPGPTPVVILPAGGTATGFRVARKLEREQEKMIFGFGGSRARECADCEAKERAAAPAAEPPRMTAAVSIPLSVTVVVIVVFGAVGWLLHLGFSPEDALVVVAGAGAVAVELIRRLVGREEESASASSDGRGR
jgi:hypothetical protein